MKLFSLFVYPSNEFRIWLWYTEITVLFLFTWQKVNEGVFLVEKKQLQKYRKLVCLYTVHAKTEFYISKPCMSLVIYSM